MVRCSPEDEGATTVEAPAAILLIEDDPGDAFLVQEILEGSGGGFTVTWVRSLAGAVATVTPETDCVLLDLGLPDAAGLDALRTIHELEPSVAIVVLTGLEDRLSGARAVALGAHDYLSKGVVNGETLARSLRYAIARRRGEDTARQLREAELLRAENSRLERGLLPRPMIFNPRLAWSTRYQPGGRRALLGGDFFDAIEIDDGTVRVVVGDVAGHGPDEAALGVALRVAWRALVLAGQSPETVLPALQRLLESERTSVEVFATVCDIELDSSLTSASLRIAGHPNPLLISNAGVSEVRAAARGPLLGVFDDATWAANAVELPDEWTLVAFTDGIIDGRAGESGGRLETKGLVDLVTEALHQAADLGSLGDLLIAGAEAANGAPLQDDVAIILLSTARLASP